MFRARPKLQCLNSGKTAFLSKGPRLPHPLLSSPFTTPQPTNQPTNHSSPPSLPPHTRFRAKRRWSSMTWEYPPSSCREEERNFLRWVGRRWRWASSCWCTWRGLLCLFLDRVLQRVMEQITETSSAGCGADLQDFLPGQGPPALRGAEHRTVLFFLEKSDVGLVAPFTDAKEAFGRIPHNFLRARAVLI